MTTSNASAYSESTIPTEFERRQLFHMLKRVSSHTAWNRMLGFYQRWADATADSLRQIAQRGPSEARDSIGDADYAEILRGLAHFEEGVRRLRQGDKRVFKYDANGEFVMGRRLLRFWSDAIRPTTRLGDMIRLNRNTPGWEAFERCIRDVGAAVGECGRHVIEHEHLRAPSLTFINQYVRESMRLMTFPDPLPDVPDPAQLKLVSSGRYIPFSGIWEPVEVPVSQWLKSLFKRDPAPQGPFEILGSMAYLHGGSKAPNMHTPLAPGRGQPVTWRLLWKDDRYEDGTIPAEEQDYVFTQPQPCEPEKPLASSHTLSMMVLSSGDKAPVGGRWLVEGDLFASVQVQQGDVLPLHGGRSVRWVLAT